MNLESQEIAQVEVDSPVSLLQKAIKILESADPGYADLVSQLQALQERLGAGRFHLAALGQTKRGKSTLLNALLGEDLLPTSVIPLTAIPTFLRAGLSRRAKVIFKDSRPVQELTSDDSVKMREFLAGFISEELNPKNRLQVEQVEIEHPAQILKQGLVLIDTPGIGSTFEHNTELTLNFLPQCDAGLFVLSPDPPITEVEVEFLKEICAKMNHLFFVFNKSDYLSEEQLTQSLNFIKRVLKEKVGLKEEPVIFPVSALKGLKARNLGSAQEWQESGMEKVYHHLVNFLAQNKRRALEEAITRKGWSVLQDGLMRLELGLKSLKMPLEQLEEKRKRLEQKLEAIKFQRMLEGDLLEGDKRRAMEQLEEQAGTLRKEAYRKISELVHDLVLIKNQTDEKFLKDELQKIIPAFFEHSFGTLSLFLEKEVSKVLQNHQEQCEELIQSIRREAAEIFEIPYVPIAQREILELEKNPHWVTHIWDDSFGMPPEGFFDIFFPNAIRRRRVLKRIDEKIDSLVVRNVENVRWSIFQILNDTFRNFADQIDKKLAEALASTKDAIESAYRQRKERAENVASELAKMDSLKNILSGIVQSLDSLQKNLEKKVI